MRTFRHDPKLNELKKKLGKKYNSGTYGYGYNRKPYRDYNPPEPKEEEFKGEVRLVRKKRLD